MARRPGRPSKAAPKQILEQGKSPIITELNCLPLHQPVDPVFNSYYQRVLQGDLAAILDYCEANGEFGAEHSFYELVGRLVPLQSVGAAKQIIAEIARRGVTLTAHSEQPYAYWYLTLKRACKIAREFIRQAYEVDDSVKRERLWRPYIDQCYCSRRNNEGAARSEEIRKWEERSEMADSQGEESPSLNDLVDRFSVHLLVPKQIFFELAESSRSASDFVGRDKRRRNRRFLWTPSSIARKYACR
jgi:hypothetical protein